MKRDSDLMLSPETLLAYDASRRCVDRSVPCHAPFTNLYFDQRGQGLACCYNGSHVLGTYPRESIESMWFGARARELREAMRARDLSRGCGACAHQLRSGSYTGLIRNFDWIADLAGRRRRASVPPAAERVGDPGLPSCLEFSLSNLCNLECVMCSGEFSSSIRRNRERAAPLASPYDAAFVEQLERFIPALSAAKFYGGEPFLVRIYLDIWERIARLNDDVHIVVTTNATVLTPRVKALLERLRFNVVVSLDSMVGSTYEAIRRNASFDRVMANFEYLASQATRPGRALTVAVCPMRQNWAELPAMVETCSRRGITIGFNTVYSPAECTLRGLPARELDRIVAHWSAYDPPAHDECTRLNLERFRSVVSQVEQWRDETARVEALGRRDVALSPSGPVPGSVGGEPDRAEIARVVAELYSAPPDPRASDHGTRALAHARVTRTYLEEERARVGAAEFIAGVLAGLGRVYLAGRPGAPSRLAGRVDELLGALDDSGREELAAALLQGDGLRDLLWALLEDADEAPARRAEVAALLRAELDGGDPARGAPPGLRQQRGAGLRRVREACTPRAFLRAFIPALPEAWVAATGDHGARPALEAKAARMLEAVCEDHIAHGELADGIVAADVRETLAAFAHPPIERLLATVPAQFARDRPGPVAVLEGLIARYRPAAGGTLARPG